MTKRLMRPIAVALIACWLAGCASPGAVTDAQRDAPLFNDRLFAAPSEPVRPDDIFALSPAMRHYAREEILPRARTTTTLEALIHALLTKGRLKLEFDAELTRNASQAFDARAGNCLSLVILTAAFAKELNLPVEYGKAVIDETWARSGNVYLLVGHVNVTLGRRSIEERMDVRRAGGTPASGRAMTIDFLPPPDAAALRTVAIPESTVVGMYMNNRAVEALTAGRVDDAYWWAREAIVQAPQLLPAYNTLGAIYARHGNLREAEAAYEHVLAQKPDNALALSNLILLLEAQGRVDEARRLAARLDRLQPESPFAHFNRGLAALQSGDVASARDAFLREVARDPNYHEFRYWLAITYLKSGDLDLARKHLSMALEASTTRRDRDIYAAKLERMRTLH
jgi:tetratricopeptide (TPR) repeat protein